MTITIRPYCVNDAQVWDEFCKEALQATFLHTRNFLSYHEDRFDDHSLILEKDNKVIGLFPAAISSESDGYVSSHPGITYGGLLHKGRLRGETMITALAEIARYYQKQGFRRLLYNAVPNIYHKAPAQDDQYALFRLGAEHVRYDLSCAIDLCNRLSVSQRRRRSFKKALRASVVLAEGLCNLPLFWDILAMNLKSKYGVNPVHSIEEITLLADKFPHSIRCVTASIDRQIVAGIVLFITPTVSHAQYIASNETGAQFSALDVVFEYSIDLAIQDKKRWFDFGISTEAKGKVINDGLHGFKCEFGGGGVVHNFYELDLTKKMF